MILLFGHFFKRILVLCILFLIASSFPGKAANDNDSLLEVAESNVDETERFTAYASLAYNMMWQDLDSASRMLDSLGRWSARSGSPAFSGRYHDLSGTFYWFKGELDSALTFYRKARAISKSNNLHSRHINVLSNMGALFNQLDMSDSAEASLRKAVNLANKTNNRESLAKIHFDLANLYKRKGFSHLALENLLKAGEKYRNLKDSIFLVYVYNALGSTYSNIGNFEKAIEYNLKSLKMDMILNEVNLISESYNNIGFAHWFLKQNYDSARYYIQLAIETNIKPNKQDKRFTYLTNLGGIEIDAGNPEKALNYLNLAASIKTAYAGPYERSALLVNTGSAYLDLNRYDSARKYLDRGLAMAQGTDAYEYAKNASHELFLLDSIQGNLQSALKHFQMFKSLEDSIESKEIKNRIAELEIIHETERKEKENQYLRSENQLKQNIIRNQRIIVILLVLGIVSAIIFTTVTIRNQRKLRKTNTELQKKNHEVTEKNHLIEEKNRDLENQKLKLSQLNQTKDKFFSVVAHDLKSPFNSLLGFLEILEDQFDELNDHSKLEIIKTLRQSSRNTYNLLVNLLDWSLSQRGMIKPDPEIVDLHVIGNRVVDFLNSRARSKSQNLMNRIDKSLVAFVDPTLTQTILINLTNNAIKFTPKNGEIIITGKLMGDVAQIKVMDNGIGIPQDKMDQLFNISSDFQRQGTDEEAGTGLGLIMCKEFIELMGGSITAESEENAGSTFTVRLPAHKQA